MKHQWKVSGKRFVADDQASEAREASEWNVTRRPGGWLVAERSLPDGSVERIRGTAVLVKGRLSVQWAAGSSFHGPYFGDWSRVEASRGASSSGAGAADFTAQFPGKVRKTLVADGDAVVEGQKLLLVEAMKMEFAIQAPSAGVVKRVRVAEGQQLSPGDLMLDFEPVSNGGSANGG